MYFDQMAKNDFERAKSKAFWRKVITWLRGEKNELLPLDDVRERLHIRGQHYLGLKEVPIDNIIGSSGRYLDFDRAFLPLQSRTMNRWISIDKAHYAQVELPPVELYKIGDTYFVRDGNHRVSVARERGQTYIDAYITEIDVPVSVTPDSDLNALVVEQERVSFFEKTNLLVLRPDALISSELEGQFPRLLEHIEVHRWYLGEQHQDITFEEAVLSWYDNVYSSVVDMIRENNLSQAFDNLSEMDLYLLIMDYQSYLRDIFRDEIKYSEAIDTSLDKKAKDEAGKIVLETQKLPALRKLINEIKRSDWVDEMMIKQDRASFFRKTRIHELFPEASIETNRIGQYETLLEHISVHRYYLGEQRGSDVEYQEAVSSWYQNVYFPLVSIFREQKVLDDFPDRTEVDLYLWVIKRQWYLHEVYGEELAPDQAASQIVKEREKGTRKKNPKIDQ